MNCPLCGEVCRCSEELSSPVLAQDMSDGENHPGSSGSLAIPSEGLRELDLSEDSGEGNKEDEVSAKSKDDPDAWRGELSARLDRYRSRRKPRPPRYPSLRLRFDQPLPSSQPSFETASSNALALGDLTEAQPLPLRTEIAGKPLLSPAAPLSAKVIEFPRFNSAPFISPDELAEPVVDRPRILEAAELELPPPALGGITMEAVQSEVEKRPGIDIPLQTAPLARRMIAAAVDGFAVAAASALFGYIFWKVTAFRPPLFQIFGLAAGIPFLLWISYEYLLIVYSARTLGLWVAGLELARFDGSPTNKLLRRWRVLASYLSAISLGMGYAWVFLDEDALCWHDRITHTYLAPCSKIAQAEAGGSDA